MKKRNGNSIIEVIVAMTIITFGLVGAYSILNGGQKLATSTENRIKGVNLAREGIEIVQNIRDTNWIKFSSDYNHCWNVDNYDAACIGAPDISAIAIKSRSYIPKFELGLWKLDNKATGTFNDAIYRNNFPIYIGADGLSTHTGGTNIICSVTRSNDCKSIFTREIQITYLDAAGIATPLDLAAKRMKVNSIVQWTDSSRNGGNYTINLETILTNWKEDL